MNRTAITEGAPAPIFERLVDDSPLVPSEGTPLRTLSRSQLRESIRCELGRLLNTRCPVEVDLMKDRVRSVINYGIPDFSHYSAANPDHRRQILWVLGTTIAAYEPRLRNVKVVDPIYDPLRQTIGVRIEGLMVVGRVTEPVSFPLAVQPRTGQIEVLNG